MANLELTDLSVPHVLPLRKPAQLNWAELADVL